MITEQEAARLQIDKILESETFRTSPVLRRLFAFLAEKSLCGEGETIKEYTIAIDGLGKPHSYDPQQDSTVRIQVGRLRQKLAEYYRLEGSGDSFQVEVPKGSFNLRCEKRRQTAESNRATRMGTGSGATEPEADTTPQPRPATDNFRSLAKSPTTLALAALLVASLVWGAITTVQLSNERSARAAQALWSPEIEQLWGRFVDPKRHVLVSMASPLYIGFQGQGVYRDLTLDHWDDVLKSKKIQAIQKFLGSPRIVPRYYYTGFGDAEAAFEVARVLGARQSELSVARSNELTWQQLADNNVISLGPARFFEDELQGLSKDLEFSMDSRGITNLHPRPGEPVTLRDSYSSIQDVQVTKVPDEGEIYVLITSTPGPLGKGEVRSFNCSHNPGLYAAMQWFTNPQFAKVLVDKLKTPSGNVPHFFQLVLDVQYKDSVPTQVSYVMHRELHIPDATQDQGHP